MKLFFRDNFFNAGQTDILNENNERIGSVDLRSTFGSSLEVVDLQGGRLFGGEFRILSNKWVVTGPSGDECGMLRNRFSLFSKRYEYDAYGRGIFEITSPAFSLEYEIRNDSGNQVAFFEKINGWFSAPAYCLTNDTKDIDSCEWISVILGMHGIQKRQHNSS